ADLAAILEALGWLELNHARPGAAESYFRRALALIGSSEGLDQDRGRLYTSLSSALLELNRTRDAAEAAGQGLAATSAAPVINPLEIVRDLSALAAATVETGDYAVAERSLTRAQEMLSEVPEAEPRELALILLGFGSLRRFQNRLVEAAEF